MPDHSIASSKPSPLARNVGWALSILPAAMLLFSAVMKFSGTKDLADGFAHLGYPISLAVPLGILEAACVVVYLVPRTAVLGAILIAGYMGGAITSHLRLGEPFIVQALLGVVVWLGLYLREPRLRALIPWRTPS